MMYSHTYVFRAKKNTQEFKKYIWNLLSQFVRRGNKFFDCWQNLYMIFSVWNLYFKKNRDKKMQSYYYNLTMIKSRERESWDGDKSTMRFLLCSSGFMNWTWNHQRTEIFIRKESSCACVFYKITIKCLTNIIHYPSKCNPHLTLLVN